MRVPSSSAQSFAVSVPIMTEQYAGMIFGWRPPASCYGYSEKTPQQVDRGACGMGGSFLGLLVAAVVIGAAVRK